MKNDLCREKRISNIKMSMNLHLKIILNEYLMNEKSNNQKWYLQTQGIM